MSRSADCGERIWRLPFMERVDLNLKTGAGSVVLRAQGELPALSLHRFAKLLGLSCTGASDVPPDSLLTTELSSGFEPFRIWTVDLAADSNGEFQVLRDPKVVKPFVPSEWRLLLACACIHAFFRTPSLAMTHGTLLETEPGHGILLYGQSGIGKSTTAKRFRKAGGLCFADDEILLVWDGSAFRAHPLPTWSAFYRSGPDGFLYPFKRSVIVDHIYWLTRGEDREFIAPVDRQMRRAQFLSAFSLHAFHIISKLPLEMKRAWSLKCFEFIEMLEQVYEPLAFHAHLDADIMETLKLKM